MKVLAGEEAAFERDLAPMVPDAADVAPDVDPVGCTGFSDLPVVPKCRDQGVGLSPSILILENEPIIAIDLEAAFCEAGFSVPHVASTCADALSWLGRHTPDGVVLDIGLADGPSTEVAKLLVARAVPFIVFSARTANNGTCDPIFHHGTWAFKPSPTEPVVAAMRMVLSSGSAGKQRR